MISSSSTRAVRMAFSTRRGTTTTMMTMSTRRHSLSSMSSSISSSSSSFLTPNLSPPPPPPRRLRGRRNQNRPRQRHYPHHHHVRHVHRSFATMEGPSQEETKTNQAKRKPESLKETLEKIQNEGRRETTDENVGASTSSSSSSSAENDHSESSSSSSSSSSWSSSSGGAGGASEVFRHAAEYWSTFTNEIERTWDELKQKSGNPKVELHQKIRTVDTQRAYDGPVSIMIIDESEHLTAWERMQRRLAQAPIIQDIMAKSNEIYETSGAKKMKEKVDDLADDAREAWETSQNPWVYRISSVYDTLTAENEQTTAIRQLRELDPQFDLEKWKLTVVEEFLPIFMGDFLEGRTERLEPWLGEGVGRRIAAEIAARKRDGVEIDTHVLGIMNSDIIACEPDTIEKGSPIILLHFMCQQINCVRKKSDGTIVEGSEDDIKANSYVAAFQRAYHEERGELIWKIVDFRFNGAIAYL